MKFLSDILAKAGLTVDGVVTLNNTATGQTPAANDNSTKLATTAWVRTFVQPYSLPIASASVLGGIKVGSGLSIDSVTGVLSAVAGGSASIKSTQTFTATSGQTVFTISGGYTVGLIDIFLNGVYLSPNQTTATDGSTVTLSEAAVTGDIIDVIIASPVYQGATTTTDQLPEGVVNLYYTNARARAAISLTVTGTSGASTYNSSTGVLNVPTYTLAGLGGVPTGRTITIDGVSYDLSANRTWNILPTGGTTGDILAKSSATNYDVAWIPNYTSQVQHQVKLGATMTAGTAVYVSSSTGNAGTNMIVSKASNNAEGTSSKTLGLIATGGATNDIVFVVTEGLLAGLDTSTATAGDPVWLGTNGGLIFGLLNKPTAPAHLVFIGVVTRAQQNNGEIFVKVQNGFELEELHNVSAQSPSDGDMIKYVASTGLWTKIAASTTNIVEGTNLYYTQSRFNTAFSGKSTTDLTEGTNLYYTQSRFDTAFAAKSTSNLTEGTNLYYTQARFDTAFAAKSTTNLTEGTNLYYTTARVNTDFDTRLATKSTTNLAEGTNLYYTDARVGSYLTTNSYATQAYVNSAVSNLIASAPAALDTLNELAAALGNDASFSTTVSTALGNRLRVDIGTQGLTSTQQGYGRTNLGLGSLATLSSIGNSYITDLAWSKLSGTPTTISGYGITDSLVYTTSTYSNPSWITALAWSKITGAPAFITSYTETDTLATVTGRGATTSTAVTFSGGASISSLLINGAPSIAESSLSLGAMGTVEGGQLTLNKATSYTYAAHLDIWQDVFRILYGTNTATSGVALSVNLSAKQLILPAYTASTSFTGTAAGVLAFDTSGNIITIAVPGGAVSSVNAGTGVSVNQNTGAITVSIGQSVATSAAPTFDQVIATNNGNGTNFKIGDDAWIGDINAANTFRVQGQQDATQGYIVFGNSNATALGRTGTGALTYGGNTVYHAGNLTNLNQLTNGPGYITSYTETSTLANVTARGASTTTRTTFVEVGVTKAGSDTVAAGPWFRWTNVAEDRQMLAQLNASNGLTYWSYNGSAWATAMTLSQAGALVLTSSLTASSIVKSGGTSSQFLKADGSVDSNSYLTGITSSQVTTALGYTPYNVSNPNGYITGITSSNVTTALGYTPYNSANPSGYITSSSNISGNAATATILAGVSVTTNATSSWNPMSLSYQAFGQRWAHSSISADTGDLVLWLRASQYAANGTEVCMMIDGDYYAGSGTQKVLHAGNYSSYALPLSGGTVSGQIVSTGKIRMQSDLGLDAGYTLYFGKEEGFSGSDTGGADWGYITYDNNSTKYGSGGGETSVLRIGTSNDGPGSVGDYLALEPVADLYFNPGGTIYRGTYATKYQLLDTGNAPIAANMNQYVRTTDDVSFTIVRGTSYMVTPTIYSGGGNVNFGNNIGLNGDNAQIQFNAAASADLFISAIPGTRTIQIRNGNAGSPNYAACGLITGYATFTSNVAVQGNLSVGNGSEVMGLLQMGASGLYGIGISSAYTNVHAHGSGNGVRLGSYNGSTFTPVLTAANTGTVTITGNISAANLSGTNTGDQTNISGYAIGTHWYHSNRDFGSGTLIETSINYSVTYGDPFILEIRGNSYGGSIPFNVQIQGYIYADTIINHGYLSLGSYISGLVAINYNGHLCFWFPRQAYWQGFNVYAYTAYGTYATNRVINVTDTAKPTTAKQVSFNEYIGLNSSNQPYAWSMNQHLRTTDSVSFYRVDATNYGVGNAIYFGGGNNYLNWNGTIHTNVGFSSDGTISANSITGNGGVFGSGSGGDQGIYISYQNSGGGYGRIRFNQDGSNHSTIHSFSASWQSGSVYGQSTGCINIDGQNGVTIGGWNQHMAAFTTEGMAIKSWATPSGAMAWNASAVVRLQQGSTGDNVFLQFRNRADAGDYSGFLFSDNNIGGYLGFRTYASNDVANGSDCMIYGTYNDHIFQNGTSGTFNGKTETFRIYGNGSVRATGDVTAYSDIRVKENIFTIDNALEKTLQLRGVYYNRTDKDDKSQKIGVIAQEIQQVLPQVVSEDYNGLLSVSYGNITGVLIEAIKEQQSQIESQKTEIEELKDLVKQLINR